MLLKEHGVMLGIQLTQLAQGIGPQVMTLQSESNDFRGRVNGLGQGRNHPRRDGRCPLRMIKGLGLE